MKTQKRDCALLIVAIASVIFTAYWQSMYLPFIQDDWIALRFKNINETVESLGFIFSFEEKLFYRPLAQTYLFFLSNLFNQNPLPFHFIALTIHLFNSVFIALIVNKILDNRTIAYSTALIYAAAVAIHLDTLAWAVGIFDLGGAFFFFASFLLFINNKFVISALLYLIGCLFKESVIILPIILFFYSAINIHPSNIHQPFMHLLKRLIPFLLIMIIIAAIKIIGTAPLKFTSNHPYAIDLIGLHIINNIYLYLAWMSQALFSLLPMTDYHSGIPKVSLFGSLFILVLLLLFIFGLKYNNTQLRRITVLTLWILVGLLPVMFLPNHIYRYYCTYSLPAFIALLLLLTRETLLICHVRHWAVNASLTCICFASVISSTFHANLIYQQGLEQQTLADGTNMLIKKAVFVNIVKNGLLNDQPTLPDNAVIVIARTDIWSFNKHSGPQQWYDNNTIRTFDFDELRYEDNQLYIEDADNPQPLADTYPPSTKEYLDLSKLFIYQVLEGKLERVSAEDVKQYLSTL